MINHGALLRSMLMENTLLKNGETVTAIVEQVLSLVTDRMFGSADLFGWTFTVRFGQNFFLQNTELFHITFNANGIFLSFLRRGRLRLLWFIQMGLSFDVEKFEFSVVLFLLLSSECGISFYWGPAWVNFDGSLFWNKLFTTAQWLNQLILVSFRYFDAPRDPRGV